MLRRIRPATAPRGIRRLALRAPLMLYRWHLGGLLGRRFVRLTHTGRTSGLRREVVLEIAARDSDGTIIVASGFGPTSQWYRNVAAHPQVAVQVGRHRTAAVAHLLSAEESGRAMADYAARRPRTTRALMRLCGLRADGTWQDYYRAGHDHIPFVALRPVQ